MKDLVKHTLSDDVSQAHCMRSKWSYMIEEDQGTALLHLLSALI